MKIFINPGHCPGKDSGAVNPHTGLQECEVALAIGRRVKNYLEAAGYEVKLHQEDSLSGICYASNNWNADLFVSIHCNAANQSARGTETYNYYGSSKGKKLATAIHNQILSLIPNVINRGVKEAGFYVIKNTNAPAVLVETAFIDNDADAKLLVEHEDEFAKAIALGISDYYDRPTNTAVAPKPDAVIKSKVYIRSYKPISESDVQKITDIFTQSLCPNESMFNSINDFKSFDGMSTIIIGADGPYEKSIEI